MTADKGAAVTPRSRSAHRVVSPRNRVNIALPLSKIAAEQPMKMRPGDWISLAGLVISAAGFGIAIWQLNRIANVSEASKGSSRANRQTAGSVAGGSSSPNAGTLG